METALVAAAAVLVAASLGAAASIYAAVWDRRRATEDERHRWEVADRRQVYARFLTAEGHLALQNFQRHRAGVDRIEGSAMLELIAAMNEVDLAGGPEAIRAAHRIFDDTMNPDEPEDLDQSTPLRWDFIDAARADLGLPKVRA